MSRYRHISYRLASQSAGSLSPQAFPGTEMLWLLFDAIPDTKRDALLLELLKR